MAPSSEAALMAPVQIALLGGFQARLASGQPLNLPQKLQALLAYLALSPGQAHPRDKLATLLWTEATHERARQSLRQALATLRQAVKPVFLLKKGGAIALDPAKVTIDVTAFELAVADGSPDALERAAALYRGDLLAGLGAQPAPFEEWLLAERERLRELAIEAVATLLAHHVQTGPIEQAIKTALRLLSLDPGAESAHRTLMRLYAQQGRRGSALRQYQICVTALERELGVEPDQETRALYQDLLRAGSVRSTGAVAAEADTALRRPGLVRFGLEAATSGIPLVGRQAELAVLREAFQSAWTGHGVTAVIQGEAGIGKSRLVETLVTDALDAGCQVLLGRAFETQQILPFGPWVEAFRSGEVVTELLARDDFDPIVRADLARLFPELGPPGRKLVSLDYVRLFEAMSQVVRGLAARQPLLLVLEDLHWADEMSLRLMAFLSRRLPAWPVIIVGTVRTEELIGNPVLRRCLDELSREPRFLYTALAALSRSETTGLVRRLARAGLDESAAGRLAERIWQVSEGNAFMVVETMRGAQDREEREMAGPLPMPARIRELISTRLTRVTDRGLQLVQAASAIGREFDFALLAQAAGLEPEKAAEGVEELVARRILHVVGERLDFTHDRIREVAYAELLAPRRRLLHARVGKTLEALYAQELEPHYLALGLHYRSAEEWERAFVYLAQAGQSAAARSAHRDAVTSFELALDAARRLPSTREVLQRGIDVRFDLRNSLLLLWQPDRIAAYVREAERLARTLDDRPRLARASAYLSHYFWRTGRSSEALVHARQALAFAEALGDLPLRVAANLSLGLASHTAGELQETEAWLGRVIDALPGHLARERLGQHAYPAVNASAHLICALAERGEFDRATRTGEETLRLAEELDHPLSVIYAYWSLAFVHGVRGESSVAANLLERALTVADRWDITDWRPIVTATLGDVYVRSGRVPDGLTLLREALSAMRSAGLQVFQSWVLVHLGDACLLANRIAEATELADQALTFARDRGERGFEAAALRLLGDIAAKVDPCEAGRAEDQYRRATELAEMLGMRPLAAQCRLRLGVLRVRCEQSNAGLHEIAAARDQFAALGMASSLERAEAELARCVSISSPAGGAQQQPLPGQRKERL